ncbi:Endocytosis and vacuole integrity protein [Entomophthora muscae]|uniref:Endocytosis and vacuole integrity protein n=1 Tax=Entomophthora muscae TaxID=34485 RepID=A0ACC2TQ95_9FUNG|nr:Endocytosis and vacuole integrity protein [Entomophthora muscae]
MSALPAYLQSELTTLSNEARRKYPEIKEACEKVIMIMRASKDRPAKEFAEDLAKTEETLKPIYLACNTKLPKLVSIAIGCLQKLILHEAVPEIYLNIFSRLLFLKSFVLCLKFWLGMSRFSSKCYRQSSHY